MLRLLTRRSTAAAEVHPPRRAASGQPSGGAAGMSRAAPPPTLNQEQAAVVAAVTAASAASKRGEERLHKGQRVLAAAVVERYPIIVRDPTRAEEEYFKMSERRDTLALEIKARLLKKRPEDVLIDRGDPAAVDPATVGPRVSDADRADDRKSLERALNERLYLLVRRANGWQFPGMGVWRSLDRDLRAVAERDLTLTVGPQLQVHWVSNSPAGYHVESYPPELQRLHGAKGGATFFYRAQYLGGPVRLPTGTLDFVWARRRELPEYLPPRLARTALNVLWPNWNNDPADTPKVPRAATLARRARKAAAAAADPTAAASTTTTTTTAAAAEPSVAQ